MSYLYGDEINTSSDDEWNNYEDYIGFRITNSPPRRQSNRRQRNTRRVNRQQATSPVSITEHPNITEEQNTPACPSSPVSVTDHPNLSD